MFKQRVQPKQDRRLNWIERALAGTAGAVLLVVAVGLVIKPPDHDVALQQCPNAVSGCIVTVDNDLATFAALLVAVGAVAAVLAILGIRFDSFKAGGAEFGRSHADTEGLAWAPPVKASAEPEPPQTSPAEKPGDRPISVETRQGLGRTLGVVPVAIARLTEPMSAVDPRILRDYRSARKASQHDHFLTHVLNPATAPGQAYSVVIRVTAGKGATDKVRSASFFFGKYWGNKVFPGQRGKDGRFGVVTEAYGPFLALCEVEFESGSRLLLDHYCDFDMGELLRP
ncbi:pYEATS domain-containing protein [Amycolatopsis sp. lyj-109]|uniref:pYEATS domain-containing protein n=1 Tax=Amycolatopsis sp. lyj-109 TaxID=2789287 RepID=UPI00397DABF4